MLAYRQNWLRLKRKRLVLVIWNAVTLLVETRLLRYVKVIIF
jgi:hypothetical protein